MTHDPSPSKESRDPVLHPSISKKWCAASLREFGWSAQYFTSLRSTAIWTRMNESIRGCGSNIPRKNVRVEGICQSFDKYTKNTQHHPSTHTRTKTSNTTMSNQPTPMNISTISAGFEKGDFLVREEQGNRVYFDFFEEVSFTFLTKSFKKLKLWFTFIHCFIRLNLNLNSHINRPLTTLPTRDTPACLERMKSTGLILWMSFMTALKEEWSTIPELFWWFFHDPRNRRLRLPRKSNFSSPFGCWLPYCNCAQ